MTLVQGTGDDERVIAYLSRRLNPAESRYPPHDIELLGVVYALRVWRHYLLGTPFTVEVQTDNSPTTHILSKKDLNARQARWSAFLAEYDFTLKHIPGSTNIVPDALSRRPDYMPYCAGGWVDPGLGPSHLDQPTHGVSTTVINASVSGAE